MRYYMMSLLAMVLILSACGKENQRSNPPSAVMTDPKPSETRFVPAATDGNRSVVKEARFSWNDLMALASKGYDHSGFSLRFISRKDVKPFSVELSDEAGNVSPEKQPLLGDPKKVVTTFEVEPNEGKECKERIENRCATGYLLLLDNVSEKVRVASFLERSDRMLITDLCAGAFQRNCYVYKAGAGKRFTDKKIYVYPEHDRARK